MPPGTLEFVTESKVVSLIDAVALSTLTVVRGITLHRLLVRAPSVPAAELHPTGGANREEPPRPDQLVSVRRRSSPPTTCTSSVLSLTEL